MNKSPFQTGTPEAVLWEFLSYPLNTADDILGRFASLPGAIHKKCGHKQAFVYVPGTRADAATLIAHADTVFMEGEHKMRYDDTNTTISSGQADVGIGADDRAGCAMLWLFKDSGHNLLVFDGEECGQKGARYLVTNFPDILKEIQQSSFMIEFDRRGANDYKVYSIPVTKEFVDYIENETGYTEPDKRSVTDICVLCTDGCCGVNLSVSYYNEHLPSEEIIVNGWLHNYEVMQKMLAKPLKKYILKDKTP